MSAQSTGFDEVKLINAMLKDVSDRTGQLTNSECSVCQQWLTEATRTEGIGFLTKTLPSIGKALDRALSSDDPIALDDIPITGKAFWTLLQGLRSKVIGEDGRSLGASADPVSIRELRQVLYCLYKYELPYSADEEQRVIDSFVKTESELVAINDRLSLIADHVDRSPHNWDSLQGNARSVKVIRSARKLLFDLFKHFDPREITPRHGPGSVSTGERLWDKFNWTNVPERILSVYPYDEYFCASQGAVCDMYKSFRYDTEESSAKVVLVPKDSRGPRLISSEPVAFQYVQQGLGQAIVDHVERHPLTRENVRFTDQHPNRHAALAGSKTGRYATLDLKDASDRVTVGLVRLLFPEPLQRFLLSCRSLSTRLPGGEVKVLQKFAPMGSALCFPILALATWSVLRSAALDTDTRKSVYVYGDDVIVPTAFAADAIDALESVGLIVNRTKSCTSGFFRESCGMDAYLGKNVTPVRLRTVWRNTPTPNHYLSWIAYANSFWDAGFLTVYEYIAGHLHRMYGAIPEKREGSTYPSLPLVPENHQPRRRRWNKNLHRSEVHIRDVQAVVFPHESDGWSMLLRYFTEAGRVPYVHDDSRRCEDEVNLMTPFSVREYTRRDTVKFVSRWR